MLTTRALVLAIIAVAAALAVGCGGDDESAAFVTARDDAGVKSYMGLAGVAGPAGAAARPGIGEGRGGEGGHQGGAGRTRSGEGGRQGGRGRRGNSAQAGHAGRPGASRLVAGDAGRSQRPVLGEQATLVAQRRIIVRTVEMALEVPDVAESVDAIGDMTEELGGWVVSSDRSRRHRGSVSVRVPAERLDEAIERLRGMASEVNAEVSTSRDVTDEYIDTTARLKNLKATESALIALLGRTGEVDDLLKVQQELTRVLEQMEQLQGRIKFLEQTSAYSLINVVLELEAVEMPIDAGPEKTFSVGQVARFRASFRPPEGIEEFQYKWDFGDGSDPVFGTRTAPALEAGPGSPPR